VTLRLEEPSQSEGDGLASDLTHPLSLSDANTARVASGPVIRLRRSAYATDDLKALPGSPIECHQAPMPWGQPHPTTAASSTSQRNSWAIFSDGGLQPSVCRGRSLSSLATAFSRAWEWTERSVALGKY